MLRRIALCFALITSPTIAEPRLDTAYLDLLREGFVLHEIKVTGHTLLTPSDINQITSPYIGRRVTFADLEAMRSSFTEFYVSRTYVNSGAVIDIDHEIENGVVTVRIIEGRIGRVKVTGAKGLRANYITDRMRPGTQSPFNTARLSERLQVLLRDPLIRRIDGELHPGADKGVADLVLKVERARPFDLTASFDNNGSPSLGAFQSGFSGRAYNLTGYGDHLSLNGSYARGLFTGGLHLSAPIGARGLRVDFRAERSDTTIIEEPFNQLDIDALTTQYTLDISRPVIDRLDRKLTLSLSLVRKVTRTKLGGAPFSFSDGAINGESKVSVLRFAQNYTRQFDQSALALRSVFSLGLDIGTKSLPGAPDGQFTSALIQAQFARRLPLDIGAGPATLILRADGQLAGDNLLTLEKFSVGGAASIRGYRRNTLVRDHAIVGSAELRVPVTKLPWRFISDDPAAGAMSINLFYDIGFAGDKGLSNLSAAPVRRLMSIGAGLSYSPFPALSGQLSYGYDLRNLTDPQDRSLQDRGIHFAVQFDIAKAIRNRRKSKGTAQ